MLDHDQIHPAVKMYAEEYHSGKLDRREFIARSMALGASAASVYALGGMSSPAQAQQTPPMGGALRVQMNCRALKDPRTYDWSELANETRGLVEYLIEVQPDLSLRPMLLESWEANEDATVYTLKLRKGVKWNNGDDFTAEDVAANIAGWCDASVEGNSMPARVSSLVQDGKVGEGVIEIVDDHTVRLNLLRPDGVLVLGFADYPAAVQHRDLIGTNPAEHNVGTGAYLIDEYLVGERVVLVKNADHTYWGEAYLDRVEFIDYGTDPSAWLAGADAGEFDMVFETVSDFIDIFTAIGWTESEIATSANVVVRPNQEAEVDGMQPYSDVRVRRALALAVDNNVPLELGIVGRGVLADNYHVAQIHPDHYDIGKHEQNVDEARRLMEEAGMMDFVHVLASIDDDYRKNTTDAVAAQLRDAGFQVERQIIPGSTFWNGWLKYPFSSTNWNHRETGIQLLNLAYRSDAAWNESAFRNAEFDALLDEALAIADSEARQEVMGKLQQMMVDEGVAIIPYWRSLYRHYRPGVINAEMHPKFEINIHHLGIES